MLTLAGAGVAGAGGAALPARPPGDVRALTYERAEGGPYRTIFTGFWRRRAGVQSATQAMTSYDFGLRGTLQHLLAARLAERHGVSLYDDPARRPGGCWPAAGSDRLWYWLGPGPAGP